MIRKARFRLDVVFGISNLAYAGKVRIGQIVWRRLRRFLLFHNVDEGLVHLAPRRGLEPRT